MLRTIKTIILNPNNVCCMHISQYNAMLFDARVNIADPVNIKSCHKYHAVGKKHLNRIYTHQISIHWS